MQDATKALLGSHGSSDIEASCYDSDPATFKAGLAVRQSSSVGQLSLTSGQHVGISLGKDLANKAKTVVARLGNDILLRVAEYVVKAQLTFISKQPGVAVSITLTSGATAGSEVVSVVGNDVSIQISNATSTTTQVKAALDGNTAAAALMEAVIASGQGATAVSTFTKANLDQTATVVKGAAVRVSSTTGVAVPSGGILTGSFYASTPLDGVDPETGSVVCKVAKIDMAGGL